MFQDYGEAYYDDEEGQGDVSMPRGLPRLARGLLGCFAECGETVEPLGVQVKNRMAGLGLQVGSLPSSHCPCKVATWWSGMQPA